MSNAYPTRRLTAAIAAAALSLSALAACGSPGTFPDVPVSNPDAAEDSAATGDVVGDRRDTGTTGRLLLLGVRPDHGRFSGGNTVTLRGSNFPDTIDGMTVTFGTSPVQPRYLHPVDRNRIDIEQVPSGMPGTVDVTIEVNGQRSRLPMAYTYDNFYVDPGSGSIAGGTRITLRGSATNWTAATTVMIDATPCNNVMFVGPSELSCVVPAHPQGVVPVTVTTGSETSTVADAFEFYEASDPNSGGFGGGHIAGSINVAVLDRLTGNAIPNAVVFVGENPLVGPPMAGITNMRGQVTLSSPMITGPVSVTASAFCHASATFVSIDGRDATIFLMPWLNRVPGVDCGMGMPPSGPPRPGVFAATVEGELVWSGPREFGPNPWYNVPMPRANERRIAYVMTTQRNIAAANPDPGMGGTVLERVPMDYGGRGYAYTIIARPEALAVYAIAGLERTDVMPPRFTPYVMGVARSVLGAPRARLTRVDIDMNIPLDRELEVRMGEPPPQDEGQPNSFRVENWIDLGGEGVIPRPDVTVRGRSVTDAYRLVAQPAFLGTLADARMIVRAAYGTGQNLDDPSSTVLIAGITTPDERVMVANWVGIPRITEPMDGGSLPATRRLRFDVRGNNPDMFWTVLSQSGSSCRNGYYLGDVVWWEHHFPGTTRETIMPDISMIPTLTDIPRGLYQLSICGFRVAGFDYNNFTYRYLAQFYWTAYATNAVTLAR